MDYENICDHLKKLRSKCDEKELLLACLRIIYTTRLHKTEEGEDIYLMDDEMTAHLKMKLIDSMNVMLQDIYLEQ